jgi:hypothetical protein
VDNVESVVASDLSNKTKDPLEKKACTIVIRDEIMLLLETYHNVIVSGYSQEDLVQACQTVTRVIPKLTEDTRCYCSKFYLSLSNVYMQLRRMITISDEEMDCCCVLSSAPCLEADDNAESEVASDLSSEPEDPLEKKTFAIIVKVESMLLLETYQSIIVSGYSCNESVTGLLDHHQNHPQAH